MGTKNDPGEYDCYEKAEPNEPMFILLARDPLAPIAVRFWAEQHALMNPPLDVRPAGEELHHRRKESEAKSCATEMERWRQKRAAPKPFETTAGDLWNTTRRLVELLEAAGDTFHTASSTEFTAAVALAKEAENEAAPF